MSAFQYSGLILVGALAASCVWSIQRRRSSLRATLPWLLLWCSAGFALAWPRTTQILAAALGIQRGADLVFYCAALAASVAFFVISLRLREVNRAITLLVRELALQSGSETGRAPMGSPPPAGSHGTSSD